MKKNSYLSVILAALMVSAVILTRIMTPTAMIDPQQGKINLEAIIPHNFSNWKIDPLNTAPVVNPDTLWLINKIYNQTLSHTYINNEGERVMISIAYGKDQNKDLYVHRPENCYVANGFEIGEMTRTYVDTTIGRIPVMHLVAKQGSRTEPITYWIRVGDSLTRGWLEQTLTTIGYELTGNVPDGLLFRISTISNNEQDAYRIQHAFLTAMLQAVRSKDRYWLVGKLLQ